MIKNKDEIRLFYETHNYTLKDVASHFDISYRTLAHWVKVENWEKGKGIECIKTEILAKDIVRNEVGSVVEVARNKIKREIEGNLGEYTKDIDNVVKANMIEESTNEVLLLAISQSFIQKNIMLSALLAKDELMRMNALRNRDKPDAMFIACAEKVAKIFESMQVSLYGKDIPKIKQEKNDDYSNMSEEELLAIINGG